MGLDPWWEIQENDKGELRMGYSELKKLHSKVHPLTVLLSPFFKCPTSRVM